MSAVTHWIADNWLVVAAGAVAIVVLAATLAWRRRRRPDVTLAIHANQLLLTVAPEPPPPAAAAEAAPEEEPAKPQVLTLTALAADFDWLEQARPAARFFAADIDRVSNEVFVPVYYATDRQVTGASDPNDYYGWQRGDLRYGMALVSIPHAHTIGTVERPRFWRFEFSEKPAKHVVLRQLDELGESEMVDGLRRDIAATERKTALVFIHGFNVTFAAGARRAAQIAHDLFRIGEDDGRAILTTVPILYSWPSNGEAVLYPHDVNNADASVPHLKAFLHLIASRSGAEAITIIAHSMGNRTLAGALNEIGLAMRAGDGPLVCEIVLAAPDIDRGVFLGMADAVLRTGGRTTLYASSRDKALLLSKAFNGFQRLGDAAGGIALLGAADSIDASVVGDDILAHSYYGATDVLGDLHTLIVQGAAPDERFGMRGHGIRPNRYWEMVART